jgi:hypothetical protein
VWIPAALAGEDAQLCACSTRRTRGSRGTLERRTEAQRSCRCAASPPAGLNLSWVFGSLVCQALKALMKRGEVFAALAAHDVTGLIAGHGEHASAKQQPGFCLTRPALDDALVPVVELGSLAGRAIKPRDQVAGRTGRSLDHGGGSGDMPARC